MKLIEKPILQEIRQHAQTLDGQTITRQLIAYKSGLHFTDVYIADIGGYLPEIKLKKVLQAFNELSGHRLTVNDVKYGKEIALTDYLR
jgi:hypothetical protein